MLPRYERAYPGAYAAREYRKALDTPVDRIRARYGFAVDSMRERHLVPNPTAADRVLPERRGRQLVLPL